MMKLSPLCTFIANVLVLFVRYHTDIIYYMSLLFKHKINHIGKQKITFDEIYS